MMKKYDDTFYDSVVFFAGMAVFLEIKYMCMYVCLYVETKFYTALESYTHISMYVTQISVHLSIRVYDRNFFVFKPFIW